jgi:hypothetical protein
MATEIYLVILLFSLTLTAFISAINARGTAKIVLSYILASLVLLASVFSLLRFMSDKQLAVKEAEKLKYEEQLRFAEEDAKLAEDQNASVDAEKKFKAELASVISKGSSIARAIAGIEVDDEDSDYDRLMGRSSSLKRQAFELKKEFEEIEPPEGISAFEDAKKEIEGAMRNLTVGANYFNLYFKAEDEDEEDERYDIYRANAAAARTKFSKASDKLSSN